VASDELDHSEPSQLAEAMAIDPARPDVHSPEELAAILKHQLDTPLSFDLGEVDDPASVTFGDLLFGQQEPSLELLQRVKCFAKFCKSTRDGPLPVEVATVLYFASIVRASTSCNTNISALDESGLRRGANWVLGQTWVRGPVRTFFESFIQHQKEF
jgi:hypothetical protein